jgi:hypothetical protein
MKVRILTNLGTNDFPEHPFLDGEEHDVPDEVASKMFRMGVAARVSEDDDTRTPRQMVKPPATAKKTE